MVENKHITKFAAILTSIVFVLCIAAQIFPDMLSSVIRDTAYSMEYEDKLFDTSEIIDINIIMDENAWQDMLDNALKEEYYECDAIINGTTFYSVGIRPKGNTSLSAIANDPDNDRYSFKLEFDQFVDGQTCFGLDKLILNNNYADMTNMKEAIVYDMYQYIGADASLYNYAKISLNSNYWGVYLALEAVEESFMLRNYGTEAGKLYKPDSMNMGARDDNKAGSSNNGGRPQQGGGLPGGGKIPDVGNFGRSNTENGGNANETNSQSDDGRNNFRKMQRPEFSGGEGAVRPGGGFGGGFGGSGTNLNYTDDSLDSYSAIWDSSVNGSTEVDHRRVVTALRNVSNQTNAEKYLDVDNLLKYMAVHNFAVNEDSLSGSMAHNYYLYEANGKLNIIPWDYNLSWGGMGNRGGNGATGTVNDAIDDSYSSTQFFDIFLKNEEYLNRYHSCYSELIEGYINSGRFEETYNRIVGQIDELVKTDPNAMYLYDEYVAAKDIFYDVIMLRAQSVSGQLDGSIPSTSPEQQNNSEALIDASGIDLSAMGSMNMGGGQGQRPKRDTADTQTEANKFAENTNIATEGVTNQPRNQEGNTQQPQTQNPEAMTPPNMDFGGMMGGFGGNNTQNQASQMTFMDFVKEYQTSIISMVLLLLSFVFVKLYKRKNY